MAFRCWLKLMEDFSAAERSLSLPGTRSFPLCGASSSTCTAETGVRRSLAWLKTSPHKPRSLHSHMSFEAVAAGWKL